MAEYYTARFSNDAAGVANKNAYTQQMAAQGWKIASELIEQGHIKGEEACCGAVVCLPLAFLAGRTPSIITLTFVREQTPLVSRYGFCQMCGSALVENARFCTQCGSISG